MSKINFNLSEMTRAWEENYQASEFSERTNAHRLLLFYAVETGLKALYMKKHNIKTTNDLELRRTVTGADILTHDINALLVEFGQTILPSKMRMSDLSNSPRYVQVPQINEMWRYGGKARKKVKRESGYPDDGEIEKSLMKICEWLKGELG